METPRVYIANLAAYNAGRLVGQWLDVTSDADELSEAIAKIARGGDWAVHDYSACPNLGENPGIWELSLLGELLEEFDVDAVNAALDTYGRGDVFSAASLLRNGYAVYDDYADWGRQYLESMGLLPEWCEPYFDFESYGEGLASDESYSEGPDGKLYVWDS